MTGSRSVKVNYDFKQTLLQTNPVQGAVKISAILNPQPPAGRWSLPGYFKLVLDLSCWAELLFILFFRGEES